MNSEIVNIKGPDHSSLYRLLRQQITELNSEKVRLLDLIEKNKDQVEDVEKVFKEVSKVKQTTNNDHLYKEIQMLEEELRNTKE